MTATPIKKYITKCRICGHQFQTSPFEIPTIGQPNERVIKFAGALMQHLGRHREQMAGFANALQEVSGLLCVSNFEMEDPQLLEMAEQFRARAHRWTRKYQISDAMIADRLTKLADMLAKGESGTAMTPELNEGLTTLMRDMRDVLTEEGRYAPKQPEPTLVTP